MRGHENIIRARLAGKCPSFVFVNDYPCSTDDRDTVCTCHDAIPTLDFRFLTGLRVSISATSEDRAKALFERVKAAGASVVAAVHVQTDKSAFQQTGWTEVFKKEVING